MEKIELATSEVLSTLAPDTEILVKVGNELKRTTFQVLSNQMQKEVLEGDVLAKRGTINIPSLNDFPVGMANANAKNTPDCPYGNALVVTMIGANSMIQQVYNLSDPSEFKIRTRGGLDSWGIFATYKAV